jgi:ubiquinone/menaquinone biosynthesis C-methylase UbiE
MILTKTTANSALAAKEAAQWIAFAPVVFQAARALRNLGILQELEYSGTVGLTLDQVVGKLNLSTYGVRVLLESGLGIGLVELNEEKYTITKTGYFILHDQLTNIHMNFVHDVCYEGLFSLQESVSHGKPEGLKVFGKWPTIYEGLSQLPAHVQKSWFGFDHYHSDQAFPFALPQVFKYHPKRILDIGGNTGKWAIACSQHNPTVHITIMDLPGQLNMAKSKIEELKLSERVSFYPTNILDETLPFPTGYDIIWMSQFLDCFSEDEIVSILNRCRDALDENGSVVILEPFWDRQKFQVASFCLQQTSLYFTALANGNSQMYNSETFIKCIEKAGLVIEEQIDNIGVSHTLLKCQKRNKKTK